MSQKNFPLIGKLPSQPSALIRLALADLEAAEKDPKYEVCMGSWHDPPNNITGRCAVCLAGAVMRGTLHAHRLTGYEPDDFKEARALEALDTFRYGDILGAVDWLEFTDAGDQLFLLTDEQEDQLRNVHASVDTSGLGDGTLYCANYEDSPEAFKAYMTALADRLEAIGL